MQTEQHLWKSFTNIYQKVKVKIAAQDTIWSTTISCGPWYTALESCDMSPMFIQGIKMENIHNIIQNNKKKEHGSNLIHTYSHNF